MMHAPKVFLKRGEDEVSRTQDLSTYIKAMTGCPVVDSDDGSEDSDDSGGSHSNDHIASDSPHQPSPLPSPPKPKPRARKESLLPLQPITMERQRTAVHQKQLLSNHTGDVARRRTLMATRPWSTAHKTKRSIQVAKLPPARCFLIVAPWGDQGLGVQAREYAKFLVGVGFRAIVYSNKPYKLPSTVSTPSTAGTRQGAKAKCPPLQASASEWVIDGVTVVYAEETREHMKIDRVLSLVEEQGVTDALLLEVRYQTMFRLAFELHQAPVPVRVYAVPNIELVRRSEIRYFNEPIFEAVLCNNNYTKEVLARHNVDPSKLRHFPFMLTDPPIGTPTAIGHITRFLLVGGMNAVSRKQADLVVRAFASMTSRFGTASRASLTITCQGCDRLPAEMLKTVKSHRNITLIFRHQSYAEIQALYNTHHVVLFCSRAEGIGIGLHEAMSRGCATIALGTPINRELMFRGANGWVLQERICRDFASARRRVGNDEMVVPTHSFSVDDLAMLMYNVASSPSDLSVAMALAPIVYYHYQLLASVVQMHSLRTDEVDRSARHAKERIRSNRSDSIGCSIAVPQTITT